MPLLALIPWWGRALALLALCAVLIGFGWIKGAEHAEAKAERVMDKHLAQDSAAAAARATQHLKDQQAAADQYQVEAQSHAKETLRRIEQQADSERKKNATIQDLTRRADALTVQLRSRPSRPDGDRAPGNASAGDGHPAPAASCTGAGLYLQDSDFLVREATRAQRVLAERESCHDKYDALTVKP